MKNLIITILLTLSLFVTPLKAENVCENTYQDIVQVVQRMGFVVTSTNKGRHNKGSKHYLGKAVDVRTRYKTNEQVQTLKFVVESFGYVFRDERERPVGQKIWGGEHVHIHVPDCGKNVPLFFDYDFEENTCAVNTF